MNTQLSPIQTPTQATSDPSFVLCVHPHWVGFQDGAQGKTQAGASVFALPDLIAAPMELKVD